MTKTLPTLAPGRPDPSPDPGVVCPPCTKCCRYVAVEIDGPTTLRGVSMALFYLYHRTISIYRSHEGGWFLLVPTPCENLLPSGLCGVYENRPLICRDYDVDGCEGTSSEPAEAVRFDEASGLSAWLARKHPALYRRALARGILPASIQAPVPAPR